MKIMQLSVQVRKIITKASKLDIDIGATNHTIVLVTAVIQSKCFVLISVHLLYIKASVSEIPLNMVEKKT